jgi:asparagine synthetase B (glutamine-hydrolysing)
VLLTGEGGDEWLTVTPLLAADLIRRGRLDQLWRLFANSRRSFQLSAIAHARSLLWSSGARPVISGRVRVIAERTFPAWLRRRWQREIERKTPSWIAPDQALRSELLARAGSMRSQPLPVERYVAEALTSLDHPLVALEREEAFENGRRIGAPVLAPYLDAELVRLLFAVPPELLSRGGRAKGPIRERIARKFPGLGFERQKKLTATSFATRLFVAQIPPLLRASEAVEALGDLGIVEPHRLRTELQDVILDRRRHRYAILAWHTLSAESWLRSHA